MKISIIKNRKKGNILFLIGIGLLLFSWSLISYLLAQPILIPGPWATLKETARILQDQYFFRIIGSSLLRFGFGFAITMAIAAGLGIAAGLWPEFAYLFSPVIGLMKAIPTMAIILLAIIWLKSDLAPILVIFLISFPILYWSWKSGLEATDPKLLAMANLYRVGRVKTLFAIYLPSAKPYVLSGLSSALGLGFKVGIGAEVLCQPRFGIGTAFQIERSYLNTAGVFAWSLICIALVALLDYLVKKSLSLWSRQ